MKPKDAMIDELIDILHGLPVETVRRLLHLARRDKRLCVQEFRD